jgi:hypothetical protein
VNRFDAGSLEGLRGDLRQDVGLGEGLGADPNRGCPGRARRRK